MFKIRWIQTNLASFSKLTASPGFCTSCGVQSSKILVFDIFWWIPFLVPNQIHEQERRSRKCKDSKSWKLWNLKFFHFNWPIHTETKKSCQKPLSKWQQYGTQYLDYEQSPFLLIDSQGKQQGSEYETGCHVESSATYLKHDARVEPLL